MTRSNGLVSGSTCLLVIALLALVALTTRHNTIATAATSVVVLKQMMSGGAPQGFIAPLGACGPAPSLEAAVAESSIEYSSGNPYLIGLLAWQRGDLHVTEARLANASKMDSHSPLVAYALGGIALEQGRDAEAYQTWQQSRVGARFAALGAYCARQNDWIAANRYFEAALRILSPQDAPTYAVLVRWLAASEKKDLLARALEGYAATNKLQSLESYYLIGQAYMGLGKYDKALDSFERAITLSPNTAWAWQNAGQAAHMLGQYEKARAQWQRAIQLVPSNAGTYIQIGHSYLAQGDQEQALIWYQRALTMAPGDPWALNSMANALADLGRYQEALGWAIRWQAVEPRPEAPLLAAEFALKVGDVPLARHYIRLAIERNPNRPEFYVRLAKVCLSDQDQDCARGAYERVLVLDPSDQAARQALQLLTTPVQE